MTNANSQQCAQRAAYLYNLRYRCPHGDKDRLTEYKYKQCHKWHIGRKHK